MKVTNVLEFYEDISDIFDAFSEETERGIAIIGAEAISEILKELITNKLVESEENKDELFDNAYSPLSNFSSRINFCFRLGIITKRCKYTLDKIRKIRNRCSHDFITIDFNIQSIADDVKDMVRFNHDLIPIMIDRVFANKEYSNQIDKMIKSEQEQEVIKKLVDDYGFLVIYQFICAFIYAYLSDKRNKILRITVDDSDSLI